MAVGLLLGAREVAAIEMFTYFGDGSRIGLPSLEVPIEAYPGIPLRSDRLRARRRAQAAPGSPARVGPPGSARGMTIRAMPPGPETAFPAPQRRPVPSGTAPIAPAPEDILTTPSAGGAGRPTR